MSMVSKTMRARCYFETNHKMTRMLWIPDLEIMFSNTDGITSVEKQVAEPKLVNGEYYRWKTKDIELTSKMVQKYQEFMNLEKLMESAQKKMNELECDFFIHLKNHESGLKLPI